MSILIAVKGGTFPSPLTRQSRVSLPPAARSLRDLYRGVK